MPQIPHSRFVPEDVHAVLHPGRHLLQMRRKAAAKHVEGGRGKVAGGGGIEKHVCPGREFLVPHPQEYCQQNARENRNDDAGVSRQPDGIPSQFARLPGSDRRPLIEKLRQRPGHLDPEGDIVQHPIGKLRKRHPAAGWGHTARLAEVLEQKGLFILIQCSGPIASDLPVRKRHLIDRVQIAKPDSVPFGHVFRLAQTRHLPRVAPGKLPPGF